MNGCPDTLVAAGKQARMLAAFTSYFSVKAAFLPNLKYLTPDCSHLAAKCVFFLVEPNVLKAHWGTHCDLIPQATLGSTEGPRGQHYSVYITCTLPEQ